MNAPFERKEGHLFEGVAHQIVHVKKGDTNSRQAVFRVNTISHMVYCNRILLWWCRNQSRFKASSKGCFSKCHWNLNSITAQSYIKVYLLTEYNHIHNFDIYVSETFLNSETAPSDPNLEISGFNMNHTDHPSNCKLFIYV